MRACIVALVLAGAVAPASLAAQAQWLSPTPPPAIRIVRETAQFGTTAAHLANERNWVKALRSKKVAYSYVGALAASGAPQVWFIGGAPSFEALGQLDRAYQNDQTLLRQLDTLMAREARFVLDARTTLATYRPDLSFRPLFITPDTRHFWLTIFTVRPGQEESFADVVKTFSKAYGAAEVPLPWVTYQVVAGAENPTFYLFLPMETYGGIDQDLAAMPSVARQVPSMADVMAKSSSALTGVEVQVLTIVPQISYVPEDFASQDKQFWQAK